VKFAGTSEVSEVLAVSEVLKLCEVECSNSCKLKLVKFVKFVEGRDRISTAFFRM
jgi:hypothetical protein